MRVTERRPLTWGAVCGGGAYLLGYLLVYASFSGRFGRIADAVSASLEFSVPETTIVSEPTLTTLFGDGGVSATTWAGWLFYNAHLVPFSVDNPAVRFGSGSVPNLVLAGHPPAVLGLLLLPPILLTLAGWLAVRDPADQTPGLLPAGAGRGALVTVGYLPFSVAGTVGFVGSVALWRRGAVTPDPLASVLLMGLAYPLFFGGLGGWLAVRIHALNGAMVAEDSDAVSQ